MERLKTDKKIMQYLGGKKFVILNVINDDKMEEIMEGVLKKISQQVKNMGYEDGKNLLCYFYHWYDGLIAELIDCSVISDNITLNWWYDNADEVMTNVALDLGIAGQELKEIIRGPTRPWPPASKQ